MANTCIKRLWESKTPVLGALLNNVSHGLSGYYYSQYSANKKYSAYYMQESYLDNSDDDEIQGSNEIGPEEVSLETKEDSTSEQD